MIEHVFAMSELRDDLETELRLLAGGVALGEKRALAPDASGSRGMGRGRSQQNGTGLHRLVPHEAEVSQLAAFIRSQLPWRSLADGTPVAMDVTDAGAVSSEHSIRSAGTPYVVISVDSWDAADAVQSALFDVAGLDEAEWTAGWTRSDRGFREITIFPPLDLAA